MYIAAIPNRTSPPAILIRESYRHQGKVKFRTLANISDWDPARIHVLRRALRADFDHLIDSDPTLGPVFGQLFALKQVAETLGIAAALGKSRLGKLALFMVLVRVPHQGSRLSAVRWAEDHAVAEVLCLDRFDEDDLYAALDDLCARQALIEGALKEAGLRFITALTDPQIRRLLSRRTIQLGLFVRREGLRGGGRRSALSAAQERGGSGAGKAPAGGQAGQAGNED